MMRNENNKGIYNQLNGLLKFPTNVGFLDLD